MGVTERLNAEIYRLRAENAKLKKMVQWLANKTPRGSCCPPAEHLPDCDSDTPITCAECWELHARKAVDGQ